MIWNRKSKKVGFGITIPVHEGYCRRRRKKEVLREQAKVVVAQFTLVDTGLTEA
jgi:hypothetical protein